MEFEKWGELGTDSEKALYIDLFPLCGHGYLLPLRSSFSSVEEAIAFLKSMLELFNGSGSIDEKVGCETGLTKQQITSIFHPFRLYTPL